MANPVLFERRISDAAKLVKFVNLNKIAQTQIVSIIPEGLSLNGRGDGVGYKIEGENTGLRLYFYYAGDLEYDIGHYLLNSPRRGSLTMYLGNIWPAGSKHDALTDDQFHTLVYELNH